MEESVLVQCSVMLSTALSGHLVDVLLQGLEVLLLSGQLFLERLQANLASVACRSVQCGGRTFAFPCLG